MTVHFTTGIDIDAPIDAVFDLALDIDLHVRSMSKYSERAVGGVTSGRIGLGQTVSWKARHFGITWPMTSRITDLDKPNSFTDQQVKGPFKRFSHRHDFKEIDGITRMTDTVEFDAPAGPIGRFVERLFMGRYILRLMDERNAHLKIEAEVASTR